MHLTDNAIFALLDGKDCNVSKSELQEHLDSCPECKKRFDEFKAIEDDISNFSLSDDFIAEKQEAIYNQIKPLQSRSTFSKFFGKKITFTRGAMSAVAFSFAMVVVGAISIYSPKKKNIEALVPSANATLDRSNIYTVSDRPEEELEEHIKAIERLGYRVILEKIE